MEETTETGEIFLPEVPEEVVESEPAPVEEVAPAVEEPTPEPTPEPAPTPKSRKKSEPDPEPAAEVVEQPAPIAAPAPAPAVKKIGSMTIAIR